MVVGPLAGCYRQPVSLADKERYGVGDRYAVESPRKRIDFCSFQAFSTVYIYSKEEHAAIALLLLFCILLLFRQRTFFCLSFEGEVVDDTNEISVCDMRQSLPEILRHGVGEEVAHRNRFLRLSVETDMQRFEQCGTRIKQRVVGE